MKFLKYIFIASLAVFSITSCDVIEAPYNEVVDTPPVNPTDSFVRKVLIEDYTGHTCGNCPKAAEAATSIETLYGDKVVVLSVHAGFFAVPSPPAPTPSGAPVGSFGTDFRNSNSTDWDVSFGISNVGNPNGMVNRKLVSGNRVVGYTNWGSVTGGIINNAPDIGIRIAPTYNSTTRKLDLAVTTSALQSLAGSYKLIVCVAEDSIITWQRDDRLSNKNVPDYAHRHVMRSALNGSLGDDILSASPALGSSQEKTYSTILNTSWNDKKMSVVAFVYDVSTKEILQVEAKHF